MNIPNYIDTRSFVTMPGGSKVAARVILVEDSTIQIAFFQPGIVSELMDTMTRLNAPIQIRISHTPITEEQR